MILKLVYTRIIKIKQKYNYNLLKFGFYVLLVEISS